MEQADENGNARGAAEVARFVVRRGKVVAIRGGREFTLGAADAAMTGMADFLGQQDFDDR